MEFCDRFVSDSDHDIEITLIAGRFDSETTPFNSLHLQIEPICIVWLRHRGISEIRICNQARYRLETDSENSPLDYAPDSEWWNQPTDSVLILQDQPLIFSEGWNCNLTLSQIDTKISFTAQEGAGLGEVSEDIPRGYIMEKSSNAEGGENAEDEMLIETIPAPSLRFDGLPDNRLVVYSFCGAVGPDVAVQASETVLIRADQSLFTVFISVAQLGGDSC
jgi:hypothetical protein